MGYFETDQFRSPLFSWDVLAMKLTEACPVRRLRQDVAQVLRLYRRQGWQTSLDFEHLLHQGYTLLVTNTANVITWASSSFEQMTGYEPREVAGKNPKLLQGPNTCPAMRAAIGQGLRQQQVVEGQLVNYRKNGEEYLCWLQIHPLKNARHEVVNYMAVEREVLA